MRGRFTLGVLRKRGLPGLGAGRQESATWAVTAQRQMRAVLPVRRRERAGPRKNADVDVRRIASVGIRVLLCLAIESVLILLVTFYLGFRGWAFLCGEQCDEGEAWIAYITGAGFAAMLPTVYVILSLIFGRTPLMMVLRVPGLWNALGKPSPHGTG